VPTVLASLLSMPGADRWFARCSGVLILTKHGDRAALYRFPASRWEQAELVWNGGIEEVVVGRLKGCGARLTVSDIRLVMCGRCARAFDVTRS
jgi:hypothetical protein